MESQEHIFMINSSVERTRGNRAINTAEDENYGEILKSGDNTLLRYKIFDGDGEILPLEGLPCEAVIKKEDKVVYRTPAEINAENIVSFKIDEVLPSDRNNPYTIEFIITNDQDTLIFPSDDRINLFIYPSAFSVDGDIINQTPESRLNEIVIVAVNDATQEIYLEVDNIRETLESEFEANESDRQQEFEANEVDRQANETIRKSQEESREIAETARQEVYDDLIDTGVMQENINQKLAESEAEYAPRLTELEQNDADLTTQLAQTDGRLDGIIVDGTPVEGNTMLIDAAVGADGVNYGTPGTNIRKTQKRLNDYASMKLTNIVKNSDYELGSQHWAVEAAALTTESNTMIATGNGANKTVRIYQDLGKKFTSNKVKIRGLVRATNADITTINLLLRVGTSGTLLKNFLVDFPTTGDWYEFEAIVETQAQTTGNVFVIVQGNYPSTAIAVGKSIEMKEISVIDLTEDFGAGREPNEERLAEIISLLPSGKVVDSVLIGSALSRYLYEREIPDASNDTSSEMRTYVVYKTSTLYEIWKETRSGKWVVYEVFRHVDVAINVDVWRIFRTRVANIAEENPLLGMIESSTVYLTSDNSQWEYAITPEGAPDFIGGFHGDEILQSVLFLIDGKPINFNDSLSRRIDRMEMAQHTVAYDPQTPANKLADIYTRHIFTDEGVRVKFKIQWTAPRTIITAYAGMLPALRGSATTTKGRFLDKPTIFDISVAGHSKPGDKTYGAELWNDTNNISMAVEFEDERWFGGYVGTVPSRVLWISDSSYYNKVYPTRVAQNPEVVKTGDIWEASFLYRFDCRE